MGEFDIMSGYTPSLQVALRASIEKIRELPLPGRVLVSPGQRVSADTPVLEAELPGELYILKAADRLGLDPEEVLPHLKVRVGDRVEAGQLLLERKSFFGLFNSVLKSPASGTVEFVLEETAHIGIRGRSNKISVNAYIDGTISDAQAAKSVTVVSEAAIIQGIFGVGGERFGRVQALSFTPTQKIEAAAVDKLDNLKGAILIGGMCFTAGALARAAEKGVVGVVTGSCDSDTLNQFVGFEIGVSMTGDENVPLSLIITEGFGELAISEHVMTVAKRCHGERASMSGATQIRAGAIRPEVIVHANISGEPVHRGAELKVGATVRCIRTPYFGKRGTVTNLPTEVHAVESGAIVRVVEVEVEGSGKAILPRANIELI
jgi:hypothetical protein